MSDLDELTDKELIEQCLEWAQAFDWFDDTFLLDMESALEKYEKLTPAQREATENIYEMLQRKTDEEEA